MHRFLIERQIPGVESWDPDQFRAVARKSNNVLQGMGKGIQWIESFVVTDRIYCVYLATDEALIREHARLGGFPCTKVTRVAAQMDPNTGNVPA